MNDYDHSCFPVSFDHFSRNESVTGRRTNQPTDGWRDTPSYSDAWTHLKMIFFFLVYSSLFAVYGLLFALTNRKTMMHLTWTFWDLLGHIGTIRKTDEFRTFKLFSQQFPTIISHNWFIEKVLSTNRVPPLNLHDKV